jgi:hypothetical protein
MKESKARISRKVWYALKQAGVSVQQLEAARSLMSEPQSVKIPRAVIKKLSERLATEWRAVITKHGKSFKVWSVEGYRSKLASVSLNNKKHKPWLKATAARMAKRKAK